MTQSLPFSVRACLFYNRLFRFRIKTDPLIRERLRAEEESKLDPEKATLQYAQWEYDKAHTFLKRFNNPSLSGMRVLDFGCRFGGSTLWYLEQGAANVIGVDVSSAALRTALEFAQLKLPERASSNDSASPKVDFRLGTADSIPVANESIDLILSEDTVEHLAKPEATFREWRRILAPGGRVMLGFGPLWYHPHGVHLWEVFPAPWSHVLFSERTCVRARNVVKGYGTNVEKWSDMNKMTVSRFKRLVRDSSFRAQWMRIDPVWGLKPLVMIPGIREFFAAQVNCILQAS